MKINVGCGRALKEGWINADNTAKEVTKIWQEEQRATGFEIIDMDAAECWPFETDIFDFVLSEHMIEHIPEQGGLFFLREAHRTLKENGVIRIACPDRTRFENLRGQDNHPFVLEYYKIIFKRSVVSGAANRVVHRTLNEQGHVWVPTIQQLINQLEKAGFRDVKEVQYGHSEHPELHQVEVVSGKHAKLRKWETISVEGIK